ncbi:GGDEF domain-containing protein [Tatumella sp. UBA2305]|uniref:GGDEF domain-containing protein n=1 Tax=Tatumella sp. UBA2305 TaxID=1947647 RepID=UPI0025F75D16|nr:GGDEF domain-containing protein [Tatumella sp. UBA2305]
MCDDTNPVPQLLVLVWINSLQMIFIPLTIAILVKKRWLIFPYRKTMIMLIPVVCASLLQSLCYAVFAAYTQQHVSLFGLIEWTSEQLATGLMMVMVVYPFFFRQALPVAGIKRRRFILLFGLMVLVQFLMFFNYWLGVSSIAALALFISARYLNFYASVFYNGMFLLMCSLMRGYHYLKTDAISFGNSIYREIFSHRLEDISLAIISVFLCELMHWKQRAVNKMTRQSETDYLTKLYNRRYVFSNKHTIISGQQQGFILLDIDNFKSINDNYGHDSGDEVLKSISSTLKELRYPGMMISRWGGEEFFVAFSSHHRCEFVAFCDHLLEAVRTTRVIGCHHKIPGVTVSCGAVFNPDYQGNFENMISVADKMLYQAKAQGKDCYVIYDI